MCDYGIGEISKQTGYDLTQNFKDRLFSFYVHCLPDIHDIDDTPRSLAAMGFSYIVKTGLVVCNGCNLWTSAYTDLYVVKACEYHFVSCRNIKQKLNSLEHYMKMSDNDLYSMSLRYYGFESIVPLKTLHDNNIICTDLNSNMFCKLCGVQQFITDLLRVGFCVPCIVDGNCKYSFCFVPETQHFCCIKCKASFPIKEVRDNIHICKIHYMTCK